MSHFDLKIGFKTDQGRVRSKNEDAINYSLPNDLNALQSQGALFIVADGVGGRSGGKEVSHFVAQNIISYFSDSDPKTEISIRLRQCIQQINAEVYALPGEGATTLLMAYFYQKTVYVAHVGDCSAYWLQNGVMNKLTQDHVMQLDPTNPLKQKLTRAIGHKGEVEVDIIPQPLQSEGYLVMVSDGVTRYLSAATLAQLVQEAPPPDSVNRIIEAANQAGGADNSSVIVIQVGKSLVQPSPLRWVGLVAVVTFLILAGAFFATSRSEEVTPSPSETPVPTLTLTQTPSASPLPPATRTPMPLPTEDTVLDENDLVQFDESAPVMREIGQEVTAFIINPNQEYRLEDVFVTQDNITWYALFDIRNEQRGWIREDELPPYTIVD